MTATAATRSGLTVTAGGAVTAFSARAEGNMALTIGGGDVLAARQTLAGLVDLDLDDLVCMNQVHEARVTRVGSAQRGRGATDHATAIPGTDALITTDPGVGLVVLVADCVPLMLSAGGHGVAAVHAGRRGVAEGVVGAAVQTLAQATGLEPERMRAVIGPAIGGCCYELPAEIVEEVAAIVPAARARTRWGTDSLDLPMAVRHQLADAGVPSPTAVGSCTHCDSDHWFSHRAAPDGSRAGRQGGVIRLRREGEA